MSTRLPRIGSGTMSTGGIVITASALLDSSGSVSAHSRYARNASPVRAGSNMTMPANTSSTEKRRNSSEVTMPKLPPPPRIAQKRSGCSLCDAVTSSPSAVTISALITLSAA